MSWEPLIVRVNADGEKEYFVRRGSRYIKVDRQILLWRRANKKRTQAKSKPPAKKLIHNPFV